MSEAKRKRQEALKNYVPVNERIERFYEEYPEGRIITDIVRWEGETVVVRADVYRDSTDETPATTGHAYETEGSSWINSGNALENCETSAVGRALAFLGFEIKRSVAAREEVARAKLAQAARQKGISSEQAAQIIRQKLGRESCRGMTPEEYEKAAEIIRNQ